MLLALAPELQHGGKQYMFCGNLTLLLIFYLYETDVLAFRKSLFLQVCLLCSAKEVVVGTSGGVWKGPSCLASPSIATSHIQSEPDVM